MHLLAFEPTEQWEAPRLHQPADWFAIHSLNRIDGFFEDAEFYYCASHTTAVTSHERSMHTDAVTN